MLGKAGETLQNECLACCLDNKTVLESIIMTTMQFTKSKFIYLADHKPPGTLVLAN